MKAPLKYSILAAGLLGAGALRAVWEKPLASEFLAAGLLSPPQGADTRDRLGQTGSAVALGGLRTLVATFLNLRAFTFFTEARWPEVADTYDIIVDLAPQTGYYWETGSWHQAYNASHWYREDAGLPPLQSRAEWQDSIARGRAFLERGIRNNPDDWELRASLGFLLSDSNKVPDYLAAARAYEAAAKYQKAPTYLRRNVVYNLIRSPGHDAEALSLARRLAAVPSNRVPGLLSALYLLEQRADPAGSAGDRAIRIFGTPKKAYDALRDYWQMGHDYPVDGVPAALQDLEARLKIPNYESVLKDRGPLIRPPEDLIRKKSDLIESQSDAAPAPAPAPAPEPGPEKGKSR